MADEKKEASIHDVSRQGADPARVTELCKALGIVLEDTKLELKDDKGTVVKTVEFQKPKFEEGDASADDKFAAATELLEQLFPPVEKDGAVVRENNPIHLVLAHMTYSFDLTQRNAIRSKEKIAIEGPDKEIDKQAKKLAAFKSISYEDALERVKLAWGIE